MNSGDLIAEHFKLDQEMARMVTDSSAFQKPKQIHETFAWLRENNPVGYAEVEGFQPFWLVTKHADVARVSSDLDCFNATEGSLVLGETVGIDLIQKANQGSCNLFESLLSMGPEQHAAHRQILSPFFMPKRLKNLEERISRVADEFVDVMLAAGPKCEFVNLVVTPYPLRVMMEILGVPRADEGLMTELSNQFFNPDDEAIIIGADQLTPEDRIEKTLGKFESYKGYFARLTNERANSPKDDLATVIAQSRIDGRPMDPTIAFGHYASFANGGHHTTASTLSGMIVLLAEDGNLFQHLKNDRTKVSAFIDEALRWWTPVKHFMRFASTDLELRGRPIRKGDWIYMSYVSANRDEEVFQAPFEFKPDRRPNRHVAFGFGPHFCIGNMLARMELKLFLARLLDRVDSLALADTPTLTKSRWVQGHRAVPIRFTAASRNVIKS